MWIDMVFGVGLVGDVAKTNRNVPLRPLPDSTSLGYKLEYRPRLVPLFDTPHPKR